MTFFGIDGFFLIQHGEEVRGGVIAASSSKPTQLERNHMQNGRSFRQLARAGVSIYSALAILSGGLLVAGTATAADKAAADVKITEEQAKESALKALPGKVNKVELEKKEGKKVYVVEIITENQEQKKDVWVDPVSGKVVGVDK